MDGVQGKHFYFLTFDMVKPFGRGKTAMVKVTVDLEKCNGDEVCAQVCPVAVFEIRDGKSYVINNDACIVCRACEIQCPTQAITVIE